MSKKKKDNLEISLYCNVHVTTSLKKKKKSFKMGVKLIIGNGPHYTIHAKVGGKKQ